MLVSIFIALALLVVAEVAYLVFYKDFANQSVQPLSQVISGPTPTLTQPQIRDLSTERIDYWGSIMLSSTTTNEYEGLITRVLNTPGKRIDIAYVKGLDLKAVNSSSIGGVKNFLVRKQDLPVTKVYESDAGQTKEIEFSQLRIGDRVKIKEVIDLKKPFSDNRLEIRITKI